MIVYTAIYGGYDFLHPHADVPNVEWRCFTDDANLSHPDWEIIVEPARFPHPRLSAKWRKCHPPLDDPLTLWIDGCVEVTDRIFLERVRAVCKPETPIALWPHPQRNRVTDEALFSERLAKYEGLDMRGQVADYLKWRPDLDDLGLFASTVIARHATPEVLQMGAAWLAHCAAYTYQDQLSLPLVLADYGLTPRALPGSLVGSAGFAWHWGHHRSQQ